MMHRNKLQISADRPLASPLTRARDETPAFRRDPPSAHAEDDDSTRNRTAHKRRDGRVFAADRQFRDPMKDTKEETTRSKT